VLFAERNALTIDFIPLTDSQALRSYEVEENTIIAMYMNNRAAELLARGRLDDAYWHAREAIEQDPRFVAAVNTLGVIYRRHDNLAEAERVLRYALAREPGNTNTMSNLVLVLQDLGRTADAHAMGEKLARLQPVAPFADFNRGMEAVRAGDFKMARELFAREVARDSYNSEFHFWLSVAYFGLGDAQAARRELTSAMEESNTRGEHDRYAAKLRKLKSAGAAQGRP
jgi:tetratricopeptide (TPR) repeat protein